MPTLLRPAALLAAPLLLAVLPPAALAAPHSGGGDDRVGIFSSIHVTGERPAGDIACVFCSVEIDGDVHGDIAVLFGSVHASPGRTVSGDVALLFSSLHLEEGDRVNGDLATLFSSAAIPSSASVGGHRSILFSGLGLAILLAPLLLLAGVIWLVVALVRGNRPRYPAYSAPPRRY